MVIAAGRKGTTTNRDQRIFESLFFCRYLSTKQITHLFFGSGSRARTRLGELEEKGYITRHAMYVRAPKNWEDRGGLETIWYLTKPGFDSVATTHGFTETYASKRLLDERIAHYILTNEVYVAVKEVLDEVLEPYPEWEWRHETRVLYSGEYVNVPYQHKPDAHIVFRGHTFILERQTTESKVGPSKIYERVEEHKRYVELKLKTPAEVLYAFDTDQSHLIEVAERAGEQYGIRVVAGDVARIADYLENNAVRLY